MTSRAEWVNAVLDNLACVDESCIQYLRANRTKIGFSRQTVSTGAIWSINRNIYLNSHYYDLQTAPNDPFLLSLLVHEVRHLQQGLLIALSVYGELEAWQLGFRVYQNLTGHLPCWSGNNPHPAAVEIMSLPLCWDRSILRRAQTLMQTYAGKGYRSDLLPLYPLGKEIKYWTKTLFQRKK